MEGYTTLHQLLESLCAAKHLKSWTVHDNSVGTVCTLRFCDSDGASNKEDTTATFRRKSQKQLNRDKERMERFKRPNTRSRNLETKRDCDSDSSFVFSDTGLSTESVCLDTHATSFHMDTHIRMEESPGANALIVSQQPETDDHVELMSIPDPALPPCMGSTQTHKDPKPEAQCDGGGAVEGASNPGCDSICDSESNICTNKLTHTVKLPGPIDTRIFREHLANRSKISWAAIDCEDCRTNVNKAKLKFRRMAYCSHCNIYFCESCMKLNNLCYCNNLPIFIT